MMIAVTKRPATYEDIVALPEHVVGEILDGELYVQPRPASLHTRASSILGVALGGAAIYHGQEEIRPPLGQGPAPIAADLSRAITLVKNSLWFWLIALFIISGVLHA